MSIATTNLACRVTMLAGFAFGVATAFAAGGQTALKINIALAQNSHYGVAIDTFAREVERRTGGRYRIQTFYSGALGAERESVEGVQLGTLDLTLTSTGPLPNFVPEVAILDIPFLFRDYAHARAVLDGPIGQELLGKFPAKGMVGLAWAENGFRHMTNSRHPVNVPDDLRGLKMRTMENPIHIEAYRQFGIQPTPMAFTEVFTALQQGTVDGQENPLSVITAAKLDQVQKYLSLTGHVYSPAVFLMNKAQWDKLSAADKQAFLEAAREGVRANRARVDDDESKAVADLRTKGMTVTENIDRTKFQAALAPAYVDFGKRFGQQNIDRIRNYR
jgi:tripartite ATP-independent transporter DctP family solute receptor